MKEIDEIKKQVSKLKREAVDAASEAKQSVQSGIQTSKDVADKAKGLWGRVFSKDKIRTGISATSKGADLLAKGARLASKGAGTLADGVEKASKEIQKMGEKIKD